MSNNVQVFNQVFNNGQMPDLSGLPTIYDHQDRLMPCIESVGGTEFLEAEEGWVIGVRGQRLMRLNTESHMIAIGTIGAGKGTSVAIPNLLVHEGSALSIEIAGSTLNETVNFRRAILGQKIRIIDPFGQTGYPTDRINPLDALNPDAPEFFTEVKLLAGSLLLADDGTSKKQDDYWEKTPKGLVLGLLLYIKTSPDIEDKDRNLITLTRIMSTWPKREWHDLMEKFSRDTGKYHMSLNRIGNYYAAQPDDNSKSIISSITGSLFFLEDPVMADLVKESTFSLRELREERCTVYVVMPEITHYQAQSTFLRLFLEGAFMACPNLGDGGRAFQNTNNRVLFVLDEFTQLGRISAVETGMKTARQKGITLLTMFQDIGGMQMVYGKEGAERFLGDAGCIQLFSTGDIPTAEYVSKRLGKRIVYIPEVTHGISNSESHQKNWSDSVSLALGTAIMKGTSTAIQENWAKTATITDAHTAGKTVTTGDSIAHGKNWNKTKGTNLNQALGLGYYTDRKMSLEKEKIDRNRKREINYNRQESAGTSEAITDGGSSMTTTTNSNALTESNTHSVANSEMQGGGRTESTNQSKTENETKTKAHTEGGSEGTTSGANYSVSWKAQILDQLDTSQVIKVVGEEDRQIILIRAQNKVMSLIDRRAYFFKIPALQRRASGVDVAPPPEIILSLESPEMPRYPQAGSLNFSLPKAPVVSVDDLHFNTRDSIPAPEAFDLSRRYDMRRLHKVFNALRKTPYDNKALEKARNLIGEFAQDIEKISSRVEQERMSTLTTVTSIARHIKEVDALLSPAYSVIQEYHENTLAKAEQVKMMQERLHAFKLQLSDDREYEAEHRHELKDYGSYIRSIYATRESWPLLSIPDAPEVYEKPEYSGQTSEAELQKRLSRPIPVLKADVAALPDVINSPDFQLGPDIDTPTPWTEILNTMIAVKKWQFNMPALDEKIAHYSKFKHRVLSSVGFIRKRHYDDISRKELIQAKEALGNSIVHRALKFADRSTVQQENFARWLLSVKETAPSYCNALEDHIQGLEKIASHLIVMNKRLDDHWDVLKSLHTDFDEANKILEARRIELHNDFARDQVWEDLRIQTARQEQIQSRKKIALPASSAKPVLYLHASMKL